MTQDKANIQEGYLEKSVLTPYQPSWINRSIHFVAGLKAPSALVYLVAWFFFCSVLTLLRWNEGVYPRGSLHVPDLVMSATGIFFLALVQYLDQWAGKKLRVFRNALVATDQEFDELVYQLSTLPAGPTLVMSLITLSFGTLTLLLSPNSYAFLNLNFSSLSGGLQSINFLFSWFVFGALSYHAYRQLNLGSQAILKYIRINLFNLDPIYAFAGLTLRTALGWLIMAYAWALTTPDLFGNIIIIATILFMQVVAILTFILPLLNAHGRIANKKDELLREIGGRLELVIDAMSKNIDTLDKDELSRLRESLATLTMAEDRLRKLPTWPWRPGTVNSLVSAILIPNAIWIFQIVLERFVFR
jgi:hypothetical protein